MTRSERILVVVVSLCITVLVLLGIWSLREPEVTAVQKSIEIDTRTGPENPSHIPSVTEDDSQTENPIPGEVIDVGDVNTTGGSIEGKVVDGNGKPILSAVVTAVQKQKSVYVFTDEDGKYTLKDLPPGSYNVRADREKYAVATKRNIEVIKDQTTPNVNFELVLGGSFAGTVISRNGDEPIPGANITIYASGFPDQSRGFARSFRGKTDSNGAFLIENMPPGDYFAHAQQKAYLPSERVSQRIESDKSVNHKFVLELGGAVSGTITDFEDNPVADAQVWLSSIDRTLHLGHGAKTNSDGSYLLEGLNAGTVNIRVIAQGFVTQTKENIEVFKGQHTEGVDFRLDSGKGISGVVVNGNGKPVINATVSASDTLSYKTARTDNDGAFTLSGFSGEKVNLSIRAPGYVFFVKREIPVGTDDLNIMLGKGGSIEGQVIADEPLVDFVVILYSNPEPGQRPRIVKQKVSRDPQGRFKMADIPHGSYTIKVNARALENTSRKLVQSRIETVEVRENSTTSGIEIQLVHK
jgi:uncharacterized GH25 family protein